MIPFIIKAKPLPSNFRGTPQQMLEAWLERLQLASDTASFVISDTMPTEDQGPWFKNGTQLWVFNGTTYEPIDVSESVADEIFVGATAPDPAAFSLWLKVAGSVVSGLYAYLDGDWRTQNVGLLPGSIKTIHLADIAVTTAKILNVAVRNLTNNIPVSKWASGSANSFARTAADTTPYWDSGCRLVSPDFAMAANTTIEWAHGLSSVPHRVDAYLVAQTDITTSLADWHEGDVQLVGTEVLFVTQKTATKVSVKTGATLSLAWSFSRVTQSFANWKIRFYITPV